MAGETGMPARQPRLPTRFPLKFSGRRGGGEQIGQLSLFQSQASQQLRVGSIQPRIVEHGDRQRGGIVGAPAAQPPDDHVADKADIAGRFEPLRRLLAAGGESARWSSR